MPKKFQSVLSLISMSPLSRVVWKVSLPVILAAASENFLHLVDTLFLARVGVAELGAIAIADSVLLLSLVIPLSFVESLQILASRSAGQRRPAAVGAVFNAGFLAVLVISVVTSVALKFLWPLVGDWFVGRARWGRLSAIICKSPLMAFSLSARALLTALC